MIPEDERNTLIMYNQAMFGTMGLTFLMNAPILFNIKPTIFRSNPYSYATGTFFCISGALIGLNLYQIQAVKSKRFPQELLDQMANERKIKIQAEME